MKYQFIWICPIIPLPRGSLPPDAQARRFFTSSKFHVIEKNSNFNCILQLLDELGKAMLGNILKQSPEDVSTVVTKQQVVTCFFS